VSNETAGGGGKRRQLGRGLSSLLGDDGDDVAQADRLRQTRNVAIENITPGPAQPRRVFDETELQSLAESITERGVLQPILLRRPPENDGPLEIIAGERRWRAAQIAGLHEIPALVREFTDTEALEIALIENIQRSDLTALEEANGFQRLIEEYGHSQEAVAQAVGKSRSHVANTLRLLALPPKARDHLEAGRLTAGHARALLVSDDADRLADYVVAGGLSVRATERLVQGRNNDRSKAPKTPSGSRTNRVPEKDADIRALEQSITESLGLMVDITPRDSDRGTLTINYQTLDQLDDLLAKLTAPGPGITESLTVSDTMFSTDATIDTDFLDDASDSPASERENGSNDVDETDTADGTVDFNALMAQTASLLASGEIEGDLEQIPERPLPEGAGTGTDAPIEGDGATALVSGILDALDIVDPKPNEEEKASDPESLDEWEKEVISSISGTKPDPEAPKTETAPPAPVDVGGEDDSDDEVEFID
jgi:ParB family transcriptional regulator, chromosome partitioning protein